MKILGIVLALLVFSFIIIFHEFGHYLLARLNDVQVNEFTLGFGPTIIGKKIGETLFAWKLLPFGGSCAMEGEDDESESSRAFCKKKVWQRFSIVFAGPLFNFILAYILASILLICAGVDMPVLSGVAEGSAAESAGSFGISSHSLYLRTQTLLLLGGLQPLCGTGVTSLIIVTSSPAVCKARIADSRPGPGPFT